MLLYNWFGDYVKKLKKVRKKYGYSCSDMANFIGISKPFYWQLENKKRNLSYKLTFDISKVFGLRPDDLFYDEYKKAD